MPNNANERTRIATLLGLPPGALDEPAPAALSDGLQQAAALHQAESSAAHVERMLGLQPGRLQALAAQPSASAVTANADAQLRALRQPAGSRIAVLHAVYGPAMDRLANGN